MERLYISAWSLANENNADASKAMYDALIARIKAWNDSFPSKKAEELEESFNEIKQDDSGIDKFLATPDVNEKQRSEIKKFMQDAEARLKMKQGESNTEYQKLVTSLRTDQDSIEDVYDTTNGPSALKKLKGMKLPKYVKSRTGKEYANMNLSEDKRITIENMYGTLINQLTTFLASKS